MKKTNLLADRLTGKEIEIAEALTRCDNYQEALAVIDLMVKTGACTMTDVLMMMLKQNRAAVVEVEALAKIAAKVGAIHPNHVYAHLSDLDDDDITDIRADYEATNNKIEAMGALLSLLGLM